MPEIIISTPNQFKQLYNYEENEINLAVLIGGRGGMKSYEASKFIAFSSTVKEKRCAILRDEQSKIRQSILNEIMLRYDTANRNGALDKVCRKLETGIKLNRTNNEVVFTMGFKASSNSNTAGLKSVSDVDIAVIEEAEDIRDVLKYNSFADGIRKKGYLIVIILNTPDLQHWVTKRYFHAEQITKADVPELQHVSEKDLEGYFKLIPRERKGFLCIQTSYKDNPHLPESKVIEYENYGDPNDTTYDLHYYLTAIKGFASSGRKGQILKKVQRISLKEYMALPFKEIYGQDFGTASPAGTVGVKFDGNNSYCREINYLPMHVKEIGKMYCRLGFNNADKIIADSAEPDTIKKIRSGWEKKELTPDEIEKYPKLLTGFFIEACDKGQGSIETGISQMLGMNLFAVTESTNLWNEVNNWVYDTDKNGNPTDDPKAGFDHLIDGWRYIIKKYKPQTLQNISNFAGAFG